MAYNRKMRKFEGTCYIPGEQLAMMAKYYRGANLNLNLTLFEDDLETLHETLDQACWCSKLDELDRMKISHMKGNEWRIQHGHCLEQAQQGPDGRNPKVHPALPQSSRSTVGKVERGTSAISLYDRERGLARRGRYQRDDYSEPCNRRDDYYDRQNRRVEYNDPRNHRGYYADQRTARDDYGSRYRRDDYPDPPASYHAQMLQNEKRTPPDRRYDMESDAAMSSMPDVHGDIRCAVCNVETCMVCKNHLNSPICQCKCPVANVGLCNRCNQDPCEEEEKVAQGSEGNKMDLSSMMLTMMMGSMFKQSQAQDSFCCCKPSRDNSDSSSSGSSDGKVHKVYLYDCEDTKRNKNPKKKSKKASSDSSCDCCKCSRKPKKNSGKKEKSSKTRDDETSESGASQKRQSTKGKGSKDSNRKSKGGDINSESDVTPKGSKESIRKSTVANHKPNKSSNEDDTKSIKSENMKSLKMNDRNTTSVKAYKGKTRGSKPQGSIDSKNVHFSNNQKRSPKKSKELSSSESDAPKRSPSPRKSPPTQRPEVLDTQRNVQDLESSNHTNEHGDTEGVGEESSTSFNLRDFIVCLPKIQSNLQSLMYKLNQMDHLNNQRQYPQIDPRMANAQFHPGGMETRPGVPLISPPENPLLNTSGSLYNEQPQLYNHSQKNDSEISIGFLPDNVPVQNLPPNISPGTSKDETKVHTPLNPPTRYHSIVNFSNLGERPESIKMTAVDWKQVPRVSELPESTKRIKSPFKLSPPVEGAHSKNNTGTITLDKHGNQWSFKEENHIVHSPSLMLPNIDQNSPQPYVESEPITSKMYCKKQPDKTLEYPTEYGVNENGVQPISNVFSPGNYHNVEIIELPDNKSSNQGNNQSKKYPHEVHKAGTTATTSSRYAGETIFQSYDQESSAETSEHDLTDYASFTDEKHFQLSPESSAQQDTYQRKNQIEDRTIADKLSKAKILRKHDAQSIISKCSRSNREEHKLHNTGTALKAPKRVTFKAKQRNPLSLEKLVQGCTVGGSKGAQGSKKSHVSMQQTTDSSGKTKMKLLDHGVGPGKFRRSKSDSSLDHTKEHVWNTSRRNLASSVRPKTRETSNERNKTRTVTPTSAGKRHEFIPLKKKRSLSPVKEKARYTMATKKNSLLLKAKESSVVGKIGFKNIPSDLTADQSDSILKMSDAYVRQEVGSQSYIVSSVEVKTINCDGSSTEILKMVKGIASKSLTNVTNVSSVPHHAAPLSSDDYDILQLLPLSSATPADGSDARSENQSGAIVLKKQVYNEVSPNTPNFLRKSRVQVEQLKRAHETIRSMIKNVNEVIAHIDSDSKIGIKSKARNEEKERQSYFVHFDDNDKKRQSNCTPLDEKTNPKQLERQFEAGTPSKHAYSSDNQNREIQKMFLSVDRVINSVLTPSDQSNVTPEEHWPSENTTPSRAHRDYFILNSESSSTAFTESLRRSLENDTTPSVPLASQQVPLPQRGTPHRPRSTRYK